MVSARTVTLKGYDVLITQQTESPRDCQVCFVEVARYRSGQGDYTKLPITGTNIAVDTMTRARALATLPNACFIAATDIRKVWKDLESTFCSDFGQDIFLDDNVENILNNMKDKFGKKLNREDIEYYEKMETAFLSESALAKDWLTPEEDEAWKDL